jgi:hypothetical protein
MGTGFLMSIDIFHGYGFGTVKPSGFVPVAISMVSRKVGVVARAVVAISVVWVSSSSYSRG